MRSYGSVNRPCCDDRLNPPCICRSSNERLGQAGIEPSVGRQATQAQPRTKSGHETTQFGRALNELTIEIPCAYSIQAKGCVERANSTLQDRLVKELQLAAISSMAGANTFFPGFMEQGYAKFFKPQACPDDLHCL